MSDMKFKKNDRVVLNGSYISTIVGFDKDQYLLEVDDLDFPGFRFSKVLGIYGDNLTWAYEHELVVADTEPDHSTLVYCSHAYGGKPTNLRDMTTRLKAITASHGARIAELGYVFVSPLHALGFMYDAVEYEEGMRQCIGLLANCKMLVLFGKEHETSRGVQMEIAFAKAHKIPVLTEEEFYAIIKT